MRMTLEQKRKLHAGWLESGIALSDTLSEHNLIHCVRPDISTEAIEQCYPKPIQQPKCKCTDEGDRWLHIAVVETASGIQFRVACTLCLEQGSQFLPWNDYPLGRENVILLIADHYTEPTEPSEIEEAYDREQSERYAEIHPQAPIEDDIPF